MVCKYEGKAPLKLQRWHDRFWRELGKDDVWCTKIGRFVTKDTCQKCEGKR